MLCCRTAIIGLVILSASTTLVAGQSSEDQVHRVQLARYGDLLREDHIELTKPALIRALKNPNPEVRYLAAMKLSEDKATDAIPEVKERWQPKRFHAPGSISRLGSVYWVTPADATN